MMSSAAGSVRAAAIWEMSALPDDDHQLLTNLMAILTVCCELVSRRACWRNTKTSQSAGRGDRANARFKAHL